MPRFVCLFAISAALTLGALSAPVARAQKTMAKPAVMKAVKGKMEVTKTSWGKTPDGKAVELYTLRNANGMSADVATFGATLVRLYVPDRSGNVGDVILGWDDLDSYVKPGPYFGATIGRIGNRIAGGKFSLDGKDYTLATNNESNHLHGGTKGWDKHVWTAKPGKSAGGDPQVTFSTVSPDGEEGYPGTVNASVTYTLTSDNTLRLSYEATTDKPTIINMTNHAYYNLAGPGNTVLEQRMKLYASRYTPVDATLIPTGELALVAGTPFDLTRETALGVHMKEILPTNGYDHNYVLDKGYSALGLCAEAYDPSTGRTMTVKTDQPGVQLYAGLGLDGAKGKNGIAYPQYGAFCLETQNFPDAVNKPNFPSSVLRPGETYRQQTEYHFGIR